MCIYIFQAMWLYSNVTIFLCVKLCAIFLRLYSCVNTVFSKPWGCICSNTYLLLSLCYFLSHEAVSCGVCLYNLFWSTWMCGESWLAIKDSLTHRPSSQGWASWCLLGLFFYAIFNFLCVMYIYVWLYLSGLGSPFFHYTL